MSAPSIVTIRPGVAFITPAAASFRRLEHDLDRDVETNSTYRDLDKQMGMYRAWEAYVNGTGPKPPHSRAIHPKYSKHCLGEAFDSDEWRTPGFIAAAAEHGWIRTAASDPTERHHFEYQSERDEHRNEPAPPTPAHRPATVQEDDMPIIIVQRKNPQLAKGQMTHNRKMRLISKPENTAYRAAQEQNRDAVIYVTLSDADFADLLAGKD